MPLHILTDTLHRRKTLISPNFCKKSASPQDKIYFSHTCTCVYHTLYNEVSFGSPVIDILHCFLLRQMVRSYQREESNRVYLISSEPQKHAHHYSHSDKLDETTACDLNVVVNVVAGSWLNLKPSQTQQTPKLSILHYV